MEYAINSVINQNMHSDWMLIARLPHSLHTWIPIYKNGMRGIARFLNILCNLLDLVLYVAEVFKKITVKIWAHLVKN